jgi:hypothetical protein
MPPPNDTGAGKDLEKSQSSCQESLYDCCMKETGVSKMCNSLPGAVSWTYSKDRRNRILSSGHDETTVLDPD